MLDIDPNLRKNFVKSFICDILDNLADFDMVWIQGRIKRIRNKDCVEIFDVADSSSVIPICGLEAIPDRIKGPVGKGIYYQILGQVMKNAGDYLKIRTVKFIPIDDELVQESWPVEVEEAKAILMN